MTVGFKRAFWTVFDSHVTTIVGALVLVLRLGTGTVKGFAFTLLWGTVFSLFTAVYITRAFVDVVVDNDVVTAPARVRGVEQRMFFRNLNWNIIGQRRYWFGLSGAVIIAGIIALIIHHGLPLGLSFTGGTTIDVKFSQPVTESEIQRRCEASTSRVDRRRSARSLGNAELPAALQPLRRGEPVSNSPSKPVTPRPTTAPSSQTQSSIADPGPGLHCARQGRY